MFITPEEGLLESPPGGWTPSPRQLLVYLLSLVLDFSYPWNSVTGGLVYPASFSQRDVFRFLHVAACVRASFLFGPRHLLSCGWCTFRFSIRPSMMSLRHGSQLVTAQGRTLKEKANEINGGFQEGLPGAGARVFFE